MNSLKAMATGSYLIALGTASLSYTHQYHLYQTNGLGPFSFVIPAMTDVLAIMAAATRHVDGVPVGLKKTATWTLAAAGAASMAANVAVATNPIQVAVGIGTVIFYLLAENFVSAIRAAQRAKVTDTTIDAITSQQVEALIAEAVSATRAAVVAEYEARMLTMSTPVQATATAGRPRGQATEKVLAILAKKPDLHPDRVAEMADVSSRTVRRVKQQLAAA